MLLRTVFCLLLLVCLCLAAQGNNGRSRDRAAKRRSRKRQGRVRNEARRLIRRTLNGRRKNGKKRGGNTSPATSENCPDFISKPPQTCDGNSKYRTIDGSCNNLNNPDWGMSMRPLNRLISPQYEDGEGEIRGGKDKLPSTRECSTNCIPVAQQPRDSSKLLTHMHMLYGQFIDHDISHSPFVDKIKCCDKEESERPDDCIPIPVPPSDPFWAPTGKTCMELRRSKAVLKGQCGLHHREQINIITSFIDGGAVYGSTDDVADRLRLKIDGLLKTSPGNHLPIDKPDRDCDIPEGDQEQRCYFAGDKRVNVWAGLTGIHLLFVREHNRLAAELGKIIKEREPELNETEHDEKVYQEARRILGAILQVITYKEYLPTVLGQSLMNKHGLSLHRRYKYSSKVDPRVVNAFSTAAFRFGHSQIPDGTQPRDKYYQKTTGFIPYEDMFHSPGKYNIIGQDNVMLGISNETALEEERSFSGKVRNMLFIKTFKGDGLDLVAVNTQRGRDHGLPSYKDWRKFCDPRKSVDLRKTHEPEVRRILNELYPGGVKDMDLFITAITEKHVPGAIVGPTFACILAEQFKRIKKGDMFWYKNKKSPYPFSKDQIKELEKTSLARVICDNHDSIDTIREQVFELSSKPVACNTLPSIDLSKWDHY